ncbi:MAG: phosphatase PAP2 family protein [Clostridia bacterium]|nr:phosphatase PAP2 family protein [Clostridia bacterium]
MNTFADWLNTAFAGFDRAILEGMHSAAEACGRILTPAAEFLTLIGEKGILFFIIAAVLLCFPKTRRAGVCVFGAVCCGALITNICLKDAVARIRPLEASEVFADFAHFINAPAESEYSFPSGHATAAMAGVTALCLTRKEKYIPVVGYIYVVLLAASRNYLMAHYPTDVIAGIIVGAFSAVTAFFITKLIFAVLEKYRDKKFFAFILDFDVRNLFRRTE